MKRRPGIASLLIGLFALNGVLCPCGPMPVADTPEVASATVAGHHAGMAHAPAGEDADATGMADCHSDSAGDDCRMADAGDPDATGWSVDRSYDTAKPALIASSKPDNGRNILGIRLFEPGALPRPPTTPIRNRDRLLI